MPEICPHEYSACMIACMKGSLNFKSTANSMTAIRVGTAHCHMLAHQSMSLERIVCHITHPHSMPAFLRFRGGAWRKWSGIPADKAPGTRQSHAHVACNRPRHHSLEHVTMLAAPCTPCRTRTECLKHDPHLQLKTGKRLRQHTLAHLTMFCGASHV